MKDVRIMGMNLAQVAIVSAICFFAALMDWLPTGMIGAFLFFMLAGEILNLIGNNLPIIKTYLGGGPIVVIFFGAAIVYFGWLPENQIESMQTFMTSGGFLNFYIAALITGSILGMNRQLLIKAAIRYFPCILGGLVVALGLVALVGPLVGFSAGEAIAYVGIPIMGGGMGAGAVPIANVFEGALGIPADQILSRLVPAVALGNAFAIVAGGLLNRLGKVVPSLSGEGNLMITDDGSLDIVVEEEYIMRIPDYGKGIIFATAFFTLGAIISNFLNNTFGLDIHTYAWMILSVAIIKAIGILPEDIEKACAGWYKFVASNFTAALLIGIGLAYTDLGQIIAALNVQYVALVAVVILGAVIGSGFVGKLVGFYPIEAAITGGLCMANMGGTGDVAVLEASNRMVLMPFAQISSRLGGALIILIASAIVPILFG